MTRPNVSDPKYVDDYRAFIKDMFYFLKAKDLKFSHRTFAKEAGFGSPNYALLLMKRERHLEPEGAMKVALGLRLQPYEGLIFMGLVENDRVKAMKKKFDIWQDRLLQEKKSAECPVFPKSEGW